MAWRATKCARAAAEGQQRVVAGVILLFCVDAFVYFAVIEIARKSIERHGKISLFRASASCGGAFSVHVLATWPLALKCDLSTAEGRLWVLVPFCAFGAAPALVCTKLILHAVSHSASSWLLGLSTARTPESDLSRARSRASRNDIEGAVSEYRAYFAVDERVPRPLFEAAELLATHARFEEAAAMFRDIMRRFRDDARIWARAAYRLADLQENYLGEGDLARHLFGEIIRRSPTAEECPLSRERLLHAWRCRDSQGRSYRSVQ
ncbi:MAG TPA: hypothetical protein HPP77_07650 [Candidatus Hydrogenedentes bacterium]|nr:hypothetical protein [Candidatus Hydrogenedentota bacterium]